MKILLVSWSVLPRSGGTSVIVEQLAENFATHELVVLGAAPWRVKNVPKRKPTGPVFEYFFTELSLWGRGARYFNWFRKWRFGALVKHIKKRIAADQIDRVIGVYPDELYCLAACRAAREMNVPFSSYFHNTYLENVAISDPKAPAIQSEIFEQSRHIFVMSKGMQTFYEGKYKLNKFVPLVHTFNEYPASNTLTGIPRAGKAHYKLVAVGNFNESNLDATKRLLEAIKGNPRYSLSLYTHVPKMLLQLRGLDPALFEHKGSVAPHEVHAVLQDYDICVLTHGFTGGYGEVEYQTIFPTRTIPLLLSGKPILAHSPSGSFLNSFVHENGCAELVDVANTAAIISGLERIANNELYQQTLVENAAKTARQFHGPEVIAELKKHLQ